MPREEFSFLLNGQKQHTRDDCGIGLSGETVGRPVQYGSLAVSAAYATSLENRAE